MRFIRRLFLIGGLWLAWVGTAEAQDVAVRRVTEHVWVLSMANLGMHTNVTVITTQKGLVVVETEITPYIMKQIKEAAEKELGRGDWAYVINTHGHLHHAGGNAVFPNAQVVGHESMRLNWLAERLSTETGRRSYCRDVGVGVAISQLRRTLTQATLTPDQREQLRGRLRFCRAVQQEIMAGFDVVNPTITVRDRYSLDVGDVHLKLTYWGDAINHSSIFVHVVEDRLLVGMGMAGTWLPDFYGRPNLESMRRAIALWTELSADDFPVDLLIGVHRPEPITSRAHFRRRAEYLEALLSDVTTAQQEDLTLQQAKDRLSLETRYAHVREHFTLPENLNDRHQQNIKTIWALLQKEASPN